MSGIDVEQLCPHCEMPVGGHTVAEWLDHGEQRRIERPYVETDEMAMVPGLSGHLLAGAVTVGSSTLGSTVARASGASRAYPALRLAFFQSPEEMDDGPTVAKVILVGDERMLRGFERLVHDAVSGAVSGAARIERFGWPK